MFNHIYYNIPRTGDLNCLCKGLVINTLMKRPLCQVCNRNLCAINYKKNNVYHYRTRCGTCINRNRNKKPPVPRWQSQGYKKKNTCDRCGFTSRYHTQILVYHIDGNLNNTTFLNLRSICLNCSITIQHQEQHWQPGDVQPDY